MATELTWLGHGSWSIATGDHQILLDPFLDDSPVSPVKSDAVQADFILVSHGHFDHVADDALEAVKLIGPKTVVPVHNKTWPLIDQDAHRWAERVRAETSAEPIVLEPGGKVVL